MAHLRTPSQPRPLARTPVPGVLVVGVALLVALSVAGPVLAYDVVDGERVTATGLDAAVAEGTLTTPGMLLDGPETCQEGTAGLCKLGQPSQQDQEAKVAAAPAPGQVGTQVGTSVVAGGTTAVAGGIATVVGGTATVGAAPLDSGTPAPGGQQTATVTDGSTAAEIGGLVTGQASVSEAVRTRTGEQGDAGGQTHTAQQPRGTGPARTTDCDRGLPAGGAARAECEDAALAAVLSTATAVENNPVDNGTKAGGGGPLYDMAFDPSRAGVAAVLQQAPTVTPPVTQGPYTEFHPEGFVFVPRQAWGADEAQTRDNIAKDKQWGYSDRIQKIVIHHTVAVPTAEEMQTDPSAYMRRLWTSETRPHDVQGKRVQYTDLTYHYVILPNGWVYEGRSASDGTNAGGTRYPGEDDQGRIVKGAGVPGLNGDLLHVALACDCETGEPTPEQLAALRDLLVELDKHYQIDPEGTDEYKNPTTGVVAKGLHNVCGHRDFNDTTHEGTECPGRNLYQDLAAVRAEVRRLCAPECLAKPGEAGGQPPTAVPAGHEAPTAVAPTDEPAALPGPTPGQPVMGTKEFSCDGRMPGTWTGSWTASVPIDYEADGRGGYIVSNIDDDRAGGSVSWHNVFRKFEMLPGSGATAVASADGHSVTVTARLRVKSYSWWLGWNDDGEQEVTCSATHELTP